MNEPVWRFHPIKLARVLFGTYRDREQRKRIRKTAEYLEAGEGLYQMIGPCGFLDDADRCAVYDDRPDICQKFEEAGSYCLDMRRAKKVPLPSIVQIELIPKPQAG